MSTANQITAPAVYVLDAGLSRFTAQAFATGLLASFGHNPMFAIRQFAGEAQFAPDAPEQTRLRIVAQSVSLDLLDRVSDKDRGEIERTMRNEVLEISRFPEIVFEAASPSFTKGGEGLFWVNLSGKLSLHGVTQPQQITTQVIVSETQLRAGGEMTIRQTAFGIKLVSVAGGTLKLKDEVKLSFDLIAHRKGT